MLCCFLFFFWSLFNMSLVCFAQFLLACRFSLFLLWFAGWFVFLCRRERWVAFFGLLCCCVCGVFFSWGVLLLRGCVVIFFVVFLLGRLAPACHGDADNT